MGNEEMLAAIKKMFVEERAITDTKLEAMQKATDSKLESMQADTDSKFEAMQKATDAKIEAAQKETIQQIKALLENGVEKQIQLLAEGHAQILARLPDAEEQGEIKARVTTLEHVVSDHTRQINELRQAQ
ncbi:hypothetical protein EQM14_04765 [Caproiciproducens sp. NJN-50]|uniref:hypothetical protein n=1 Tax=Caproiciproducens sp. NJN-50 TaxID=2507162 RepID=UPI000FFDFB23|nr:hypothetical protein [Caproiciproducens sp. NJN-50]QAT49140.1 hypothetical protein EQM14_04765 [Caproiciproducens sp. NJN-50]